MSRFQKTSSQNTVGSYIFVGVNFRGNDRNSDIRWYLNSWFWCLHTDFSGNVCLPLCTLKFVVWLNHQNPWVLRIKVLSQSIFFAENDVQKRFAN
jgi:hypothetical protein